MGLLVPCGQCMNCRLQKREEWVLRLKHEFDYWEQAIFVTLTYSDEHLPESESLVKADLQKFFKRVRKNLGNLETPKSICYFGVGEYGEEKGRPHYHIIIYGMDFLNETDRLIIKKSWELCDWEMLGDKPFGSVCDTSIRYVVSYLEKSIKGKWEVYAYDGIESPFHVMSKGIGKRFAKDNKDNLERLGYCPVNGHKRSIPRYYSEITGIKRDRLQKIAEEKEVDDVKKITGYELTRDQLYREATTCEVVHYERAVAERNKQHDVNLKARDGIRQRRFKRDI